MHWVCATTPDGRPVHVNLGAVQTMLRLETVTAIFLGGMTMVTVADANGAETQQPMWARTDVRETPDQLFGLPKIVMGIPPAPLPHAIVSQAANAIPVDHVEPKRRRARTRT